MNIQEAAIRFCTQLHGITMARYHAIGNKDVFAEPGRGAFQCDAIIIRIHQQPLDENPATTVNIEAVVVVVIAVIYLEVLNPHMETGQIMLHPATRVLQGDILHGNLLALDETDEMRSCDALVVPRQLFKRPALSVDGAFAINHHILHLVGIDQLDGGNLRAQRHKVRLHRPVVHQGCAAIERRPFLQIEMHVRLQHDGTRLIVACRHHNPTPASLRAVVDGPLDSHRTQHGRIRLSPITHDIVIRCRSGNSE